MIYYSSILTPRQNRIFRFNNYYNTKIILKTMHHSNQSFKGSHNRLG